MSGNALHRLFSFAQPRAQHVVTSTFHERAADAALEVPGVHGETVLHLRRQAMEISRGNHADEITALLMPEAGNEAVRR
jgi:hypothetical protein